MNYEHLSLGERKKLLAELTADIEHRLKLLLHLGGESYLRSRSYEVVLGVFGSKVCITA